MRRRMNARTSLLLACLGRAALLMLSVESFGGHSRLVSRAAPRRKSIENEFEELHELLARAETLIKATDVDLLQTSAMAGKPVRSTSNQTDDSISMQNPDNYVSRRSTKSADDSTGFLVEMQRKLESPDFKRIFDDRRIKGLKGYGE